MSEYIEKGLNIILKVVVLPLIIMFSMIYIFKLIQIEQIKKIEKFDIAIEYYSNNKIENLNLDELNFITRAVIIDEKLEENFKEDLLKFINYYIEKLEEKESLKKEIFKS